MHPPNPESTLKCNTLHVVYENTTPSRRSVHFNALPHVDITKTTLLSENDPRWRKCLPCAFPVYSTTFDDETDATGIVALSPPKDEKAFRIRLEDQLAGLLGAGFRSRTKAMVNRRQGRKPVPGGGGRWRRTPYFSDYTTGVELVRKFGTSVLALSLFISLWP